MNFMLAGILLLTEEFKWQETVIYANLLIGIFNLLPIYPLDGGRMLKAILENYYKREAAEEILNKLSNIIMVLLTVIASIGVLYLRNIAILCIIIYLWFLRITENKKHRLKRRVQRILNHEEEKVSL